jgi:hypothetical protein
VRKVSGSNRPSKRNQAAFDCAVADISASVHRLLDSFEIVGHPPNRDVEAAKALAAIQFG